MVGVWCKCLPVHRKEGHGIWCNIVAFVLYCPGLSTVVWVGRGIVVVCVIIFTVFMGVLAGNILLVVILIAVVICMWWWRRWRTRKAGK